MMIPDSVEFSRLALRPVTEPDLASLHCLTKPRPRLVEQ